MKAVVDAQPRLDVVVNCAGVIRRGEEHDPEVFADVVDIDLVGMQRVCSAARGRLAERGGSIVNLASMLSFFGGGLVPAYSASKGGVAQLTKSLAIAYAADGIRVNAIAPGWIATALTAPLRDDPARDQSIRARTPLGRWGEPGRRRRRRAVPRLAGRRLRHRRRPAGRRRLPDLVTTVRRP